MNERFTFKKEPRETGLRSVGSPYPNTQIKLNRKECGTIYAPSWSSTDNKWSVAFMVPKPITETDRCDFAWKTLKRRFDSEPEAREFVQSNAVGLIAWGLYLREETDE